MPKKQKEENNDIKIRVEDSSLAEFTRRPLPTYEEVQEFEDLIDDEVRDEDVEESLSEIYQDDDGSMVDVQKMDIKRGKGFFFWFFVFLFFVGVAGGGFYYFYNNFYANSTSDATAVNFFIEGETDVVSGEEFFYTIHYKNANVVSLKNGRIEVSYPENFIFLDSEPVTMADKNNVWNIDEIGNNESGEIKIKGKILSPEDTNGVIFADFSYEPENFSSSFSKKASLTTEIKDIGLDIDFDYISTALVGEEEEIGISYKAKANSFISDFRLVFEPQENVKIIGIETEEGEKAANITLLRPGVWQINEVLDEKREMVLKFEFTEKIEDNQNLLFTFEKKESNDRYFEFYSKEIDFEIMKSDLNLTLIVNGSREDQGIDAGGKLNYSLVFVNKGETDMKNVVLMAVLESDFLDWETLQDELGGIVKGDTITWTKEQLSDLESLARHEEGTIDFSIDLSDLDVVDGESDYEVKSYVQFSVGQIDDEDKTDDDEEEQKNDNRSNTIVNKINSNLELAETLRYFDENNIPVGIGPNPPKVGEETNYRVYWDLTNSLHELEDLKVSIDLPTGITWKGKDQVSVGSINYDTVGNKIVWNIGRLPATVHKANAEFNVGVIPTEDDKNKIMIILPGSTITATDTETDSSIMQITKAKTSKLDDDDVGKSDGIVE